MLGLSANLNYYLFNGNVDLRKGICRLCESIRQEMLQLTSGATLFLRNTTVLDLSLLLNKMIG